MDSRPGCSWTRPASTQRPAGKSMTSDFCQNMMMKYVYLSTSLHLLHRMCDSTYISRVFNFTNFESFAKFIQLTFGPLHCQAHGQHASAKFSQQILLKQLFAKI